jgi:glycosyltransferase involved in cell wall biosynthesis
MTGALRVALLSYRAHPEVGGQGIYVRYLSEALTRLGHQVTVFAGPPYPDLAPGTGFVPVPSLDLYRPQDPFRRPKISELNSPIDLLEYGLMCAGAFPEPLTFSVRVARALKLRTGSFDIVHDNQSLGYGLLRVARRVPLLTTIHHPISVDRTLALQREDRWDKRLQQRRWYSFIRMQRRVARRLPMLLAVSESARQDSIRDFGVMPSRIAVVPNGIDAVLFRPLREVERRKGRIVTVASSDQASKGLDHLLEAVAKLRTERDVELTVIGHGGLGRSFREGVARYNLKEAVSAPGRVDVLDMVKAYAEAEVAVIPSSYEGFSLPAVEAMACGIPLVATTGGALGEVVRDGGLTVPPGDAGALAKAIAAIMDDRRLAESLAARGRARAAEHFTWEAAAQATVELYRRTIAAC